MKIFNFKRICILIFILIGCVDSFAKIDSSHDSIVVSRKISDFLANDLTEKSSANDVLAHLSNGDLYIIALNVGQANFLILIKEKHAVIIDAGLGNEKGFNISSLSSNIKRILEGCLVDAVFITHPHNDHFSLFLKKSKIDIWKNADFNKTIFFLGGAKAHWKKSSHKKLLARLSDNEVIFCSQLKTILKTFLKNVEFRIFDLEPPKGSGNKLSLIIQASFLERNILFTGDTEGDSIDRIQRLAGNLAQIKKLLSLKAANFEKEKEFLQAYDEQITPEHDKYWTLYNMAANIGVIPSKSEFLEIMEANSIPEENDSIRLNMRLFENSQVIFIPHHGTNTKNSQRFLGFFSGLPKEKVFIVSSSPFEQHNLPKESTLEMAPKNPSHPPHPFIYGDDYYDLKGNAEMKITNKPIYVTGSAPNGFYCLKVSQTDKNIYMLNFYDRKWFNVLTGK
ncbi:hypothetical protein FACS189472_12910 [Alphaproteobacteria bacterium]|nr:hypothetical protein FACS189472_12910 [Alphaproteobacteria bacterium]